MRDETYAREVLGAEDRNMRWDDAIKEVVDRAPPLTPDQVARLRLLLSVKKS